MFEELNFLRIFVCILPEMCSDLFLQRRKNSGFAHKKGKVFFSVLHLENKV